jgi:hypothetical protein
VRQYEAVDGPYLRWLQSARKRVGERVWEMLMEMEQSEVEAVFRLKGVVPYEYSAEKFEHDTALASGEADVKLVLVHYGPDVIVEVDRDDDPEARAAKFPRFTRDLD